MEKIEDEEPRAKKSLAGKPKKSGAKTANDFFAPEPLPKSKAAKGKGKTGKSMDTTAENDFAFPSDDGSGDEFYRPFPLSGPDPGGFKQLDKSGKLTKPSWPKSNPGPQPGKSGLGATRVVKAGAALKGDSSGMGGSDHKTQMGQRGSGGGYSGGEYSRGPSSRRGYPGGFEDGVRLMGSRPFARCWLCHNWVAFRMICTSFLAVERWFLCVSV